MDNERITHHPPLPPLELGRFGKGIVFPASRECLLWGIDEDFAPHHHEAAETAGRADDEAVKICVVFDSAGRVELLGDPADYELVRSVLTERHPDFAHLWGPRAAPEDRWRFG